MRQIVVEYYLIDGSISGAINQSLKSNPTLKIEHITMVKHNEYGAYAVVVYGENK